MIAEEQLMKIVNEKLGELADSLVNHPLFLLDFSKDKSEAPVSTPAKVEKQKEILAKKMEILNPLKKKSAITRQRSRSKKKNLSKKGTPKKKKSKVRLKKSQEKKSVRKS